MVKISQLYLKIQRKIELFMSQIRTFMLLHNRIIPIKKSPRIFSERLNRVSVDYSNAMW